MFNSKYTGEEIEALLDRLNQGGGGDMFSKTDIIADSVSFASSNVSLKVRDIIANNKIYLCFDDVVKTMVAVGDTLNSNGQIPINYSYGSTTMNLYTTIQPSHVGVGTIFNIVKSYHQGDLIDLYGVAFCDKAYSSWDNIPTQYKCEFKAHVEEPEPEQPVVGSVNVETTEWEAWSGIQGYTGYRSASNSAMSGKDDTIAKIKLVINNKPDFELYINSYAENGYDYVVAFGLDTNLPSEYSTYIKDGATGAVASTKDDSNGAPTSISNFKKVEYHNDGGEHFVWIVYRKDGSTSQNDNRGYILIPNS